ncbi:hypothetical protein BD289DRAFT_420305 [Coniella lustricola]|uniref:Uncharacterized protein n=1 Tax=Coniella lustricola TaxID=2025994 RepID=A0A2T3AN95_9PEZI|nr:hypothetical protein BD289DRAFT_420305 [Coniella lustricola]
MSGQPQLWCVVAQGALFVVRLPLGSFVYTSRVLDWFCEGFLTFCIGVAEVLFPLAAVERLAARFMSHVLGYLGGCSTRCGEACVEHAILQTPAKFA